MRVIGGTAKGMKLDCPPGEAVRPMPEMAREALFNILRDVVEGARVLDLFAGAGSFAIEALSRGAARAVLVELARKHKAFIDRNLEHTRLADRAFVLLGDAFRSPRLLQARGEQFDLVYIGPPFPLFGDPQKRGALVRLLDDLVDAGLLAPGARLIVQHDVKDFMPEETRRLAVVERRTYGRNVFSFYAPPTAASPGTPAER